MTEVNVGGIYVPILLLQACVAYLLLQLTSWLILRFGLSHWVAAPSIFYLALYLVYLFMVHWVALHYASFGTQ